MAQGKSSISKKKPNKSQGGIKKKLGKTKKGLKKQVKAKKENQIISKSVWMETLLIFMLGNLNDPAISIQLRSKKTSQRR